jgi:TM2 domain-containing membrane protein YozV
MSGRPSRAMAVVLALLFGWIGAHWFYLGNRRRGWTYVALFPLALASVFAAYCDALRFVWVDRATFDSRFVGRPQS